MPANNLKYVYEAMDKLTNPWCPIVTLRFGNDRYGNYRTLSFERVREELTSNHIIYVRHYDTLILMIAVNVCYDNDKGIYFKFNPNVPIEKGYYGIWVNCTSKTDCTIINSVFNYLGGVAHYTRKGGLKL